MPKTKDPAEVLRQEQIAQDTIEREISHQQSIGDRARYNPQNQPREFNGRYQKILARLKETLGDHQLEQITKEINVAQQRNAAGSYQESSAAAQRVMTMISKIKAGAVDDSARNDLRQGAADLGRVLAYLPLPQGVDAAKVRFSDLPPSTRDFVKNLVESIMAKLQPDVARSVTVDINNFLSGETTFSADKLSAEMNKLLRFLVK